jgi:hypothetical protein
MYSIVSGEAETSAEVLLEEGGLVLLDVLNELGVDGGLELGASIVDLLLALGLEEGSASGLLLALEESLVAHGLDIDSGGAHLGGGSDGVNLIDASEGNSVDLAWAADEEESGLELLEEDNSLAAESSGGEDEDGAGLNALAELGGLSLLGADSSLLVFGRVPIEFFDH